MIPMKNDLWEAVHDIFRKFDEFFGDFRSRLKPPAEISQEAEIEEAEPETIGSFPPNLDELLQARTALRSELDAVNARLAERLSERDAYLVLFPIVAHFDELVQTRFFGEEKLSWPPLQGELFQIDDAGELFYDTLDDLLMKPQTLPFVLEVFYFCLSDGFQGRHNQNPKKIREYMDRLRNRIPVDEPRLVPQKEERPEEVGAPVSSMPYYAAALVALLLFYGVLLASSWLWNPL